VWTPKGAASYADSLVDRTGNGNNAYAGAAPTWAAGTGWHFDPADYLLVNFGAASDQSQSMVVRCQEDNWAWSKAICAQYGGAANRDFGLSVGSGKYRYDNGGGCNGPTGYTSNMVLGIIGNKGYRHTVHECTVGGFVGASTASKMAVGGRWVGTYLDKGWKGWVYGWMIWDRVITEAEFFEARTQLLAL
jgi:hypothetical protein